MLHSLRGLGQFSHTSYTKQMHNTGHTSIKGSDSQRPFLTASYWLWHETRWALRLLAPLLAPFAGQWQPLPLNVSGITSGWKTNCVNSHSINMCKQTVERFKTYFSLELKQPQCWCICVNQHPVLIFVVVSAATKTRWTCMCAIFLQLTGELQQKFISGHFSPPTQHVWRARLRKSSHPYIKQQRCLPLLQNTFHFPSRKWEGKEIFWEGATQVKGQWRS